MALFMGIDVGTSSTKITVIDEKGNMVGETSASHPVRYLDEYRVEQNPNDWMKSTFKALKKLKERINIKRVKALAFTGQMIGLVCVNTLGDPVRPSIIWADQRTHKLINNLSGEIRANLKQVTCNPINTAYTLPRILWIRESEPQNWEQTWKWMLPKDYVKYKFSGVVITDFSDASGTLLLNVRKRRWADEVVEIFNLERMKFPDLASSKEVIGKIRADIAQTFGFNEDTLIVNGCADLVGESLVGFEIDASRPLVRLGSAGSISRVVNNPLIDEEGECTCYVHAMEGKWIVELSSQGFGICERWLREQIIKRSENVFIELDKMYEESDFSPSGMIFVPPIKGAPYWEPMQVGAVVGFTFKSDALQLLQAVLEGSSFSLKDAKDRLQRLLGERWRSYLFSGGGTRSLTWVTILANILNGEACLVKATPSIGAAILAGKAVGIKKFERLSSSLISGHISPSPEIEEKYRQLYRVYNLARGEAIEIGKILSTI